VTQLLCGRHRVDLGSPRIMGVINVTPDSFSDGGRLLADRPDLPRIIDTAQAMVAEGAAFLDVGGESTRPGAAPVSEEEELRRVLPVIEALAALDAVISVDTSKPAVARRAVAAGAQMVNDVTGARDPDMRALVAETGAALCLMHMQGTPRSMQRSPVYDDVVAEVGRFLVQRVDACRRAGIESGRLLIDPGFGFGKTLAHNIELLRHLRDLRVDGVAMLVGLSRKRMIGDLTGRPVDQRAVGSAAAALLAVQHGADVVRVHDVAPTADALRVLAAVRERGAGTSDDEEGR
jgi:dihydropteroate synthase